MFEAGVWMEASVGIQLYLFILIVGTITSVHLETKSSRLSNSKDEECGILRTVENECDQPKELEWKDGREKVSHSLVF